MFRFVIVALALAGAQARPQQFFFGQQPSSSSGQSTSTITKGETVGPGGVSTITQQQTGTGGQATNGGFNFGTATGGTQSQRGPLGSGSTANTDTQSVQGTLPGFGNQFGGSFGGGSFGNPFGGFGQTGGFPSFPRLPSSATGQAQSQLTQGETVGPDGSQTTITMLGSSAGGSAENGGTSFNQASGSTSNSNGLFGQNSQSNLNSQSVQTGR